MGGFVGGKAGQPKRLYPNELSSHTFKLIEEEDILDKSKGSILSKGFMVLQTGWFILQCIGRGVQCLPVTELEITTLALAVLNFVIYMLWWNKPLCVAHPIHIHVDEVTRNEVAGLEISSSAERLTWAQAHRNLVDDIVGVLRHSGILGTIHAISRPALEILGLLENNSKDNPKNMWRCDLYAGEVNDEELYYVLGPALGLTAIVFGGIHCIAWSFKFPSPIKQTMWRICSIALVCLPLYYELQGNLMTWSYQLSCMRSPGWSRNFVKFVYLFTLTLLGVLYLLARTSLLVLTMMSLWAFPPGTFHSVYWASFIPHI